MSSVLFSPVWEDSFLVGGRHEKGLDGGRSGGTYGTFLLQRPGKYLSLF